MLRNGSPQKASELWSDLVAIAAELRPCGGSVDLPGLLQRLEQYSFQEHPNYRADWNTLGYLSSEAMANIHTQLGPGITILREPLADSIAVQLEALGVCVLVGESGSGKSALAKSIATSGNHQQVVWFDGQHLEERGLGTVGRALGLANNLTKFLPSFGDKRALLVLDALESFSPQALQNAVELIKSLDPVVETSRWRVLMTSQPLRWEWVLLQLHKYGLQLPQESVLQIELPDSGSLAPVTQVIPRLSRLMLQPELGKFLRNLKILDWVANTVSSSPTDNANWVGVSDIIDSVWAGWIQTDHRRYSRDGILKKIGAEEAQSLSGVVSLNQLTTPDREVLADLEDRGLLSIEEGKVNLSHDLLGDWSRLKTLISIDQSKLPSELRDRVANPRWHKAIHFYGLRTLERAPDSSQWFQLIQQLDDNSGCGQLAADLILEAVAFASNAYHLLERVWPHLSANDGALLKRLLKRFRHSASFPDPRMASLTSNKDLDIWLASSMRIPIWSYWEPMLIFLHAHTQEVKTLALESAGELCKLWLSKTPTQTQDGKPFPWRRQAAELALAFAREVQGFQAERGIVHSKAYESVYEAFLYAASDLPEQVSALALELAKRRPPAAEIRTRIEESKQRQAEEHKKRLQKDPKYLVGAIPPPPPPFGLEIRQDPWPSGPMEAVNEAFREACLKKGALLPLISECPEVAKEVVLALCIEPPQRETYRSGFLQDMRCGTVQTNAKAMFFTGPFLTFLQINPKKALELIIELVDFATERWLEWAQAKDGISTDSEGDHSQTVDIWIADNRRSLIGNSRVFGWYRETWSHAPYVVSALMALEKWLYDEVKADEDISEWIKLILENAKSAAFLGTLVALSKRHPELLLGCLKPVMSVWQVYQWDFAITQQETQIVLGLLSTLWVGFGDTISNLVKDWNMLPHRKIYFRDVAIQMLLNYPELQEHFEELRTKWRSQLKSLEASPDALAYHIERFNPANYRLQKDEQCQQIFVLEWPENLRENSKKSQEYFSYSSTLMSLPIKCRKILDTKTQLEESELEGLWQSLQYLVNAFDEFGDSAEHLHNAIAAGIAVLFILNAEWIEADEKKTDWCLRQLKQVVMADHPREILDTPHSVSDTRWEIFVGEMAVHLLAQGYTDKDTRFLTAQGVLAYHYNTTGFVFKAAWQNREKLGEEFDRLLNLGGLWAGIRWALERCQSLQLETPKLHDWYNSTLLSFVDQSLQSDPIPFREIAVRSESLIREAVANWELEIAEGEERIRKRYPMNSEVPSRSNPGLDWQVIQAAYGWLPPLTEASSEQERKKWIAVFEELLQLELIYIQTAPRDQRGEVEDTPYVSEYWVFQAIAHLVPQLRDDEQPQSFWQPILDLGGTAHYWVESFLSSWFIIGSRVASELETFAKHWQSMIEYALESPLWQNAPSTPGGFHLTTLYIHLMGLDSVGTVFSQEEYTDIITQLFPLYEKWAREWLKHSRVAEAFTRCLVKPAARKLILPGLTWLAEVAPGIREHEWERSRLSDELLTLLCTCWSNYLPELESDSEVKKAFLSLLSILVARGHPGALELQDTIVR
jgi:energy-coupling factor transporter ATP-binding protein EcfA2